MVLRLRRLVTPSAVGKHAVLAGYTLIALFPIVLVVMNSFKTRNEIFGAPLAPPTTATFSLAGYETLIRQGDFFGYIGNSIIVTGVSLLLVLLFGSMAAFALARYRFRGSRMLGLYLALGIMIPIRLGTVSILNTIVGARPCQHPSRSDPGLHGGGPATRRVHPVGVLPRGPA